MQVHLTPSVCRFHLVVQIEKHNDLEPRDVIMAAMAPGETSRDIKVIIVVDSDIDPYNLRMLNGLLPHGCNGTGMHWWSEDCRPLWIPLRWFTRLKKQPNEMNAAAQIGIDATKPLYSGKLISILIKLIFHQNPNKTPN